MIILVQLIWFMTQKTLMCNMQHFGKEAELHGILLEAEIIQEFIKLKMVVKIGKSLQLKIQDFQQVMVLVELV